MGTPGLQREAREAAADRDLCSAARHLPEAVQSGGMRVGAGGWEMRVGSRGCRAAALPCRRACLPLPASTPGPGRVFSALGGGGAAAGTRSPLLHKGESGGGGRVGWSFCPAGGRLAAGRGSTGRSGPAGGRGGLTGARREGWWWGGRPESPWAPARNTQLIITSRKTPRPRPPETPALRNPPQPAPPWAPRNALTSPGGFSLCSP